VVVYLCNGIDGGVFADEHVGQPLQHVVLQCEERLVWDAESRHEHNHLPVEMQTTYTV